MNNFFDEYLYKKEEFDVLQKAYRGVFDIVGAHIEETARNTVISKTLAFKKIRFQMIDVSEASYTMSSLLNNNSVLAIMGLAPSTPYDQKLKEWGKLTPLQKADILDVTGYSILLTSYSAISNNDEYSPAKFNIIDFELSDMNNNHYIRNVDYVFRDNKLFILREFSVNEAYTKKSLILKNITIDTNSTEDILGVPLNIPYSDQFTKTEYNETLRSFIQAAAGGPTLEKLNVALARYKTLQGVKVYDKYSSPPSKKSFWGFDGYIGSLTVFDFLVALPLTFAYNSEKLDYITNFFDQIKPAYTNFTFVPQMDTVDRLILKYQKDTIALRPVFEIPEKIKAKEIKEFRSFKILSDGYTVISYRNGDDAQFYTDRDVFADRCMANDSIIALAASRSFNDILSATDSANQKSMLSKTDKITAKKDDITRALKLNLSENYSIRQQAFADHDDYYDLGSFYDIFTFDDRDCHIKVIRAFKDRSYQRDSVSTKPILSIIDRLGCKRQSVITEIHSAMTDKVSYLETARKKTIHGHEDTLAGASKVKTKPILNKSDKLSARDNTLKRANPRIRDRVSCKGHNITHETNLLVTDRISHSERYRLLNRANPCDRIVVRKDAPTYKQKQQVVDTLKVSKYTNTVYCDGVFSYDDVGGIFYDSNEDKSTKSRESVTMRLIPK